MNSKLYQGRVESIVSASSSDIHTPAMVAGRGRLLALAHQSSDASAEATVSSMSKLYIESSSANEAQRHKEFVVTQIPSEDDIVEEVTEEEEKVLKKIGMKGKCTYIYFLQHVAIQLKRFETFANYCHI